MNSMSKMALGDWCGNITIYSDSFTTTPKAEHADLTWPEWVEVVCPKCGPQVLADKSRATYVTPGLLQNAPLIGKTLEKAQREGRPTFGKQRSANHVTNSTFVMFDVDGLPDDKAARIDQGLKDAGITYSAYTSYSYGLPEKPGMRARYAIPIDRAVDSREYSIAWHGANANFFEGAADPTGAKLCQQQGVWAIGPERKHLARRWGVTAGVASADALMGLAPVHPHKTSSKAPSSVCREWDSRPPSLSQIKAAIAVLDPNDYANWDKVVSLAVALSKGKGMDVDALKRLVVEFSDRADEDRRAGNDKTQYSPQARFDTWQPSVSPSVAAATLFATARDRAVSIYRHASQVGNFKGTRAAWSYLAGFHPKTWNELRAEMEATA